jgi:protein-L-isoaspartate O-methyltransferase
MTTVGLGGGFKDLTIGPYQAIHVGAAAPSIPTALIEQVRGWWRWLKIAGESWTDVYSCW